MRLSLNFDLLEPGDRLLIGVSGGVDSLALLHALVQQRGTHGWSLLAVHIHHGMRGAAADADAEFLRRCCGAWHVPFIVEEIDVPALARERRISVEEAGREARYEAFARLARETGCRKVVTAHHADDQAETVLLHLFRGAGIDGLAGMPGRRPLTGEPGAPELIRPLLAVRRRELEAYCREQGLEPRLDITNLDLQFRRNRIRYELLPALSEFDPAIIEHLVRLACQAQDERELLSSEAERLLERAALEPPRPVWGIPLPASSLRFQWDVAPLREAPPALLRRALRLAVRQAGGFEVEQSADLIERLVALVHSDSAAVNLPGCPLRATLSRQALRIEATDAPGIPLPVEVALPGRSPAPQFGLELNAVIGAIPDNLHVPPAQAILDPDSLRPPFQLRVPHSGDRFRPLNAPGSRLVSDLFIDRKVPAQYRSAWPILTDRDGILWVVGLAVAHRARIRPETARACLLSVRAPGAVVEISAEGLS